MDIESDYTGAGLGAGRSATNQDSATGWILNQRVWQPLCGRLFVEVAMHTEEHDGRFRFCPICGGSMADRVVKTGDPERGVCERCGYVHYVDPKVAVGAIIRARDGEIVLVRRSIEPGYGKWVFPGGYVDRGEKLEVAAVREAREEAGLDIVVEQLMNVYSYPGRTPIIVVYTASVTGGQLCAADECLEAGLFARHEIPWDELAFVSTREALEEYFSRPVLPPSARPW